MTKAQQQTIYNITFEGEYRATAPLGQDVKRFSITVRMLASHVNYNPVSVFMKSLADQEMPKKYPDYLSIRKCAITNTEAVTPQGTVRNALEIGNLKLMNRTQLTEYIEQEGLPVETNLYATNGLLMEAVHAARKDMDAFLKQQDQLRSRVKTGNHDLLESAKTLNQETASVPAPANDSVGETQAEPEPVAAGKTATAASTGKPGRPARRSLEDL